MAIQTSFLNQLITNESPLDPDIITPDDSRWMGALQSWDASSMFAVDCETYGEGKNDGLHQWKGKIRLIQIGLPNNQVILADLGGWDGCNPEHRPSISKQFLPRLKKHLFDKSKQVLGFRLVFDLLYFKVKWGFEARNCLDLMLMSQVIWAGLPIQHNLKSVAERVGFSVDKTEQMSEWGFPLNNNQLNYAAKDVKILFPIADKLNQLVDAANLHNSIEAEMLALPCFVQFEYYGMPVDYDKLIDVLTKYQAITEIVLKPFSDLFPGVNPDSSQQVIDAIRDKLQIHLAGTAQEHLAPYWDRLELKALSLWRTLTTYIDYLENVKKCYFDGAVRGVYRQINPSGFGRSTCGKDKKAGRNGVNLQNPPNPNMMPKELQAYNLPAIRSIFRANEDDQMLVSDLSAAHARIAAEASQDQTMFDIYAADLDVHCVTASGIAKLMGKDWTPQYIAKTRKDKTNPDQVTCELYRQVAKPTFYGSLNAQEWRTLQKTVKTDVGIDLSDEDAKAAIKAWRKTYSGIYNFQLTTHKKASQNEITFDFCIGFYGEVKGLSNRRIFMPLLDSKFSKLPEVKFTDCVSFVWTSTEADIIKYAMGMFLLKSDEFPHWQVKLRNMAHDELDVTCNKEFAADVAAWLQYYMRYAMQRYIKSIPPDDMNAKPESLLVSSWQDK